MTTVPATPQQMKDRLLQAIDGQSNIRDMAVVMEVITCLEKYPITKEALEETRLGKLINDVRKKASNEDLAKRAKKLLRNWQKLIEPGPPGAAGAPASTNGSSHPCRTDAPAADVPVSGKGVPEGKTRNDVHNTYSPKAEKSGSRKRRAEQRDGGVFLPEKISRMSSYDNSVSPPTNGLSGSPDAPPDQEVVPSPDRSRTDPPENDKATRIPINAVKPRPSSPGAAKPLSASSLIKVAVMQQARLDEGGGGGGYQARSPRSVASSPRSGKQDSRRSAALAARGTSVPSPSPSDSPLPFPHATSSPGPPPHSALQRSPAGPAEPPPRCPAPDASTAAPDSPAASPALPHPQHNSDFPRAACDDADGTAGHNAEHRRRKYRSRDFSVNLDGQRVEDTTKPVRLKERRITFDPVTGQIKPLAHKEPSQSEDVPTPDPAASRQGAESLAPPPGPGSAPGPGPHPFHQTNWKELSRNEIIQSYLSLQSNVLTSSGVQAPSAHFFMAEYLRREEQQSREQRKSHVLQAEAPAAASTAGLPGLSRAVTDADLDRMHTQRWPGVNGCYDTQGAWYDWTECISLDPHGDDSRLHVLPYVCLD